MRLATIVFTVIICLAPSWPRAAARAADATQTYTTKPGDTLGQIARRYLQDDAISPYQMMLALFRTNPEAFVDDNINHLKAGYRLRMPARATILETGIEDAEAIVKRQYAAWLQSRSAPEPAAPPISAAPEQSSDEASGPDVSHRATLAAEAQAPPPPAQRGVKSEALRARVDALEERLTELDDRLAKQRPEAEQPPRPAEVPSAAAPPDPTRETASEMPDTSPHGQADRLARTQVALVASGVILGSLILIWLLKRRVSSVVPRPGVTARPEVKPPTTDKGLAVDIDDVGFEVGTAEATRAELIIDLDDLELDPAPHQTAARHDRISPSGSANMPSTSRNAEAEAP